jgi:hypothetical protein
MGFVIPQVSCQRIIQQGIADLKANPAQLDNIFDLYLSDPMINDYGQEYIDEIKTWFTTTRIPVVQAWSFNKTRIPGVSIHLAQEMEDETKAAMGDYGFLDDDNATEGGVGIFTVNLDIGIHATTNGDEVLWLYYIISYCLFTQKKLASQMGLHLHTFNGSDYDRANDKLPDNIWTRWIRFRCTVNNQWVAQEANPPFDRTIANVGVQSASSDNINEIYDVTAPIRDEP